MTELTRVVERMHAEWCGKCLMSAGNPCRIVVLIEATLDAGIDLGAALMRDAAVKACHPGNDLFGEVAAAIRALTLGDSGRVPGAWRGKPKGWDDDDPRCPRCGSVDAGRKSGLCVCCSGIVARGDD